MKTVSDILFVQREAVGRVAFEVVPDLLGRIELRGILGKELRLKARVVQQDSRDRRTLVNFALVPQEDDRPWHVVQKLSQERGHVHGLEVVLLESGVQANAPADRADRKDRQGRDAVVLIAVGNLGGLTFRAPRPSARRNEQKAAFIKERQMGPKFAGVFLYAATCIASSVRSLPRPAARAGVLAPGRTNATPATPATHGWDDTGRRTPGGPPGRCVSASTVRWDSRRPWPLSAAVPATADIPASGAFVAGQGPVLPPALPVRPRLWLDASGKRRRSKSRPDGTPLPSSGRCSTVPWPVAAASPMSSQIRVVSYSIDRRFPYITFAKLNK